VAADTSDGSDRSESSRVLVRKVVDLRVAVWEAFEFLGYDFAGKRVWVKPNLLSPHRPEEGVTTDPELIRHIVRELKRRGAAAIWVADNPAGAHVTRLDEYLAPTGVVEASEGCFRDIAARSVIVPVKSRFVTQMPVSAIVNEADVILNAPVFKTHALTIITGAVKNMFGVIPGGHKSYLHSVVASADEFAELLVDIYQAVPKPMVHIMDGLRGMDGFNGPSSGRVLKMGIVLAGRNGVALDAVMTMMAGGKPGSIPTCRIAAERGLGPIDRSQIDITGDFERVRGFILPRPGIAALTTRASRVVYSVLLSRLPVVNEKLCTACEECARNCPVQAIAVSGLARVDYKRCVACFCCVEICPARAMTVARLRRSLWARLTGR